MTQDESKFNSTASIDVTVIVSNTFTISFQCWIIDIEKLIT